MKYFLTCQSSENLTYVQYKDVNEISKFLVAPKRDKKKVKEILAAHFKNWYESDSHASSPLTVRSAAPSLIVKATKAILAQKLRQSLKRGKWIWKISYAFSRIGKKSRLEL